MHALRRASSISSNPAKFAALQITGGGLLVALWLSGYGQMLLAGDRFHAVPVLAFVTIIGLVMGWRGKWGDAEWVADLLPILGLVGTVTAFILVAATADLSNAAGKTALAIHILYALVSNLGGIVGYAWLTLCARVCR